MFIDMCAYRQYYSSVRRKEILSFGTTRKDLECSALNEINQMEKDKYCMISLVCGIKKINKTNQHMKANS